MRDWAKENLPPEDPGYVAVQRERLTLKKAKIDEEKELEEMTPEDYVVRVLKARVVDVDGVRKVEFKRGTGQSVFAPLANIKEITPENNSLAGIHMELWNKEFVYNSGKEPTDKFYAELWEGWDWPGFKDLKTE